MKSVIAVRAIAAEKLAMILATAKKRIDKINKMRAWRGFPCSHFDFML